MTAAAIDRKSGSIVGHGRYRLIRVLGRGGMGVVYEAEHTMTRRRVAVKVLHAHHSDNSDAGKRFINEAQAAGRIAHPNVVEVLDAGKDDDGALYLVLELLTGQDLATRLTRARRLEVAETVVVVAQVLHALEIAHRGGIIHRDIKPENIFLTRSVTGDTHVKILDFGISKAIGPNADPPALSVTQTNTTVGTPHYMAPEQARGERNIDTRADLWATGVVMYECLAGRVPFDGDTYNDQIVRVITEPHLPLSNFDVPLELSRIVDGALEKDRNRRYLHAADMLGDIRRFIERHREYASVPLHLLRDPVPPAPVIAPVRGDRPTIETSRDPSFTPLSDTAPGPRARNPSLPSLVDMGADDGPTLLRSSPTDSAPPGSLLPLAGHRDGGDAMAPLSTPGSIVPPRRSGADERIRNLAIAGGLLLASVLIGSIAALVRSRHRTAAAPAPIAAPSTLVTLRFAGMPAGATLTVGGTAIGASDTVLVPRSAQPTLVEVDAPGFTTVRFPLTPTGDQVIPVTMAPTPVAPAPQPANEATALEEPEASATPHRAGRTGEAFITVRATPTCRVLVDGIVRGRSPIAHIPVDAGTHRVLCQLPTGALRTRIVTVTAAQTELVNFSGS